MSNTMNLDTAINYLSQFSNDLNNEPMPDTNTIYFHNYQTAAVEPQQGWRPMSGSSLSDTLMIMMDKIEEVEATALRYSERISELEQQLDNMQLDQNEEMLGIA